MSEARKFPGASLLVLLNIALPAALVGGAVHFGPGVVQSVKDQMERRSWRVEVGKLRFEAAPPWTRLEGKDLRALKGQLMRQATRYGREYGIEKAPYPDDVRAFRHAEDGPLLVAYRNYIDPDPGYLTKQKTEVEKRLAWGAGEAGFEPVRNELTEVAGMPCLFVEFQRGDATGRLYTFMPAKREAVTFSYIAERPSPAGDADLERLLATLEG